MKSSLLYSAIGGMAFGFVASTFDSLPVGFFFLIVACICWALARFYFLGEGK